MRVVDDKKFDEMAKALVRADSLSTPELERIVSNPALFDSIRMRIALETPVPQNRRPKLRVVLAFAGSFATLLVALLGFATFGLRLPDRGAVPPIKLPDAPPKLKQHSGPDTVVDPIRPPVQSSFKAERISTRPVARPLRPRQPEVQPARYEGDFYALSYAGDPNETERGGRIVRVDIPRSTLFAMGVDIPLENEAETVKADLLIGNDGVTRAIRVIK